MRDRGYDHDIVKSCNLACIYCTRKGKAGNNFYACQKGLKFALYLLGANDADIPFFVNHNEFVVPDCLRQYLGLAIRKMLLKNSGRRTLEYRDVGSNTLSDWLVENLVSKT